MIRALRLTFLICLVTASSVLVSAQITFTQTMIQANGSFPGGIVAGDFNNDGILDLVTVNGNPDGGGQIVSTDFNADGYQLP